MSWASRLSSTIGMWRRGMAGPLMAWRGPLQASWQRRTPREQALLRTAGWLLVIVIPWVTVIQPAWHQVQDARQQLMTLSLGAAELQSLILETQDLQQNTPGRMGLPERNQALVDSLARSGLSTSQVQQADPEADRAGPRRWSLAFDRAPAAPLLAWLAQTPGRLGLRIESLALARSRAQGRELPDQLDGTVQLMVSEEALP